MKLSIDTKYANMIEWRATFSERRQGRSRRGPFFFFFFAGPIVSLPNFLALVFLYSFKIQDRDFRMIMTLQ